MPCDSIESALEKSSKKTMVKMIYIKSNCVRLENIRKKNPSGLMFGSNADAYPAISGISGSCNLDI